MLSTRDYTNRAILWIMIAATAAVIPIAIRGNPWGHDIGLHLRSWMEAEQQFLQGTMFPRWAAGANRGYGGPFFIFYPPLSRLVGMPLGLLLPWQMVPGIYIWLMLVLAGAAMWKCAREWLDPTGALLASLIYATHPYLLIIAYKRSNYADLLASALFPLLVWAGIRMGHHASKTILPLAMVFSAIWLADLPSAVVASYGLAMLLVLDAVLYRSLKPILCGVLAMAAAFGGTAFFLFPAAWEQRWVNIAEAVRFEWAPEHNFLFTRNNLPDYVYFNQGLSFVAVLLVMAATIAAVLARRLRRDHPNAWLLLTVLGGISTFMMFRPSLILYQILPELRYVEFPWRWLSPLCVVGSLLVASALSRFRRKWLSFATVALFAVTPGAAIIHTVNWDTGHRLEGFIVDSHSATGYPIREGDWSSPLGSQLSRLDKSAPRVVAMEPEDEKKPQWQRAQIEVEQWSGERKVFSVASPHPLQLKTRLLAYPAWEARLNGAIVPLGVDRNTGQILLQALPGLTRIELQFVRTWDRTFGIALSLITILTIVPIALWLRKWK